MSDLDIIEIARRYGALDETAAGVGDHVHAHVLRELARQAHRLALTGNYLTHQVWNVDGSDSEAPGTFIFSAGPSWTRVIHPFPVERKAHLRTADLYFHARITDGATVLVQLVTGGHAFRPDARSSTGNPNVVALVGTGLWQDYAFSGIRLGPDEVELLELWVTADATGNLMDEGVYGAPNQGAPTAVQQNSLSVAGATWNMGAINSRPGALVVRLYDGAGAVFASDRPIQCATPTSLTIPDPAHWWTRDQVAAANNPAVAFRILEVPTVRFGAFQVREQNGY